MEKDTLQQAFYSPHGGQSGLLCHVYKPIAVDVSLLTRLSQHVVI